MIDRFRFISLSKDPLISLDQPPLVLSSLPLREEITQLWSIKREKNPLLFNGELLFITSVKEEEWNAFWGDYALFLFLESHSLFKHTQSLWTLGVSALTQRDDALLLGKRSSRVAAYPLHYDLCPSGSVDKRAWKEGRVVFTEALISEFMEESGLGKETIQELHPLFALLDQKKRHLELFYELKVVSEKGPFLSWEWEELIWVSRAELPYFLQHCFEMIVPIAHRALLHWIDTSLSQRRSS